MKDGVFGLVDCNNFFVSCERVFRPDLRDKPVVVLSNNDGCVIARSNESKALGIRMGEPFFKVRDVVARHGVAVFSSNFSLYGDMSRRVMSLLSAYTPRLDIYSVDEAVLDLTGMGDAEFLRGYGRDIVRKIGKGVGIPVSLGVAGTKTLAKMASKYAKRYPAYEGVCLIDTEEKCEKALRRFAAVACKRFWNTMASVRRGISCAVPKDGYAMNFQWPESVRGANCRARAVLLWMTCLIKKVFA